MGKNKPRVRFAKSPVQSGRKASKDTLKPKLPVQRHTASSLRPSVKPKSPTVEDVPDDLTDDASSIVSSSICSSEEDYGLQWPDDDVHLIPEAMFTRKYPHPPLYVDALNWRNTQHLRDTFFRASELFDDSLVSPIVSDHEPLMQVMHAGNLAWALNFEQVADLYERYLRQSYYDCEKCHDMDQEKELVAAIALSRKFKKLNRKTKQERAIFNKEAEFTFADLKRQLDLESPASKAPNLENQYLCGFLQLTEPGDRPSNPPAAYSQKNMHKATQYRSDDPIELCDPSSVSACSPHPALLLAELRDNEHSLLNRRESVSQETLESLHRGNTSRSPGAVPAIDTESPTNPTISKSKPFVLSIRTHVDKNLRPLPGATVRVKANALPPYISNYEPTGSVPQADFLPRISPGIKQFGAFSPSSVVPIKPCHSPSIDCLQRSLQATENDPSTKTTNDTQKPTRKFKGFAMPLPVADHIHGYSQLHDGTGNVFNILPMIADQYSGLIDKMTEVLGKMPSAQDQHSNHNAQNLVGQDGPGCMVGKLGVTDEGRDARRLARHDGKAENSEKTLLISRMAEVRDSDSVTATPVSAMRSSQKDTPIRADPQTNRPDFYQGMVLATFSSMGIDRLNFGTFFPDDASLDMFFASLAQGRKPTLNWSDAEWKDVLACNPKSTKRDMLLRWRSFSQSMFHVYGSKAKDGCGKKECKDCSKLEINTAYARDLAMEEIRLLLESKKAALRCEGGDEASVEWSKKASSKVLADRAIKPLPKRQTTSPSRTTSPNKPDVSNPDLAAEPAAPSIVAAHHANAPNFDFVMPRPLETASIERNRLTKLVESTGKTYFTPYLKAGIDMFTISWFLSDVEKGIIDKNSADEYRVGDYDQKQIEAMWTGIALDGKEFRK